MAKKINTEHPVALEHLKFVALKLDSIRFNCIEESFKRFFRNVEVLHLTTQKYDYEGLNAKWWEQLISTYMPNLRIYDINYYGFDLPNHLTFHQLINQFQSSFWISKQWFFSHQHHCQGDLDQGVLYSTNPYR